VFLLSLTACLVNEDLYNQRRAEVIDEAPVDRTGSVDADPYDPPQTDPD
jgi:hypothetical protein